MSDACRHRPARRLAAVLALAALAACAAPARRPEPIILRVAYPGSADFDDLPSLLAHASLETQGYKVETTHYRVSELAAEALARGDAQFASGSIRTYWAAASRGAPVRTVMDHAADVHQLVVESDIRDCEGLEGQSFALHSAGAVGAALARAYLAEECAGVRPRFLMVPNSDNRAAALLAGAVRASVLTLAEVLRLEQQAPGRFRVLSDFAARWPHVKTTGAYVNVLFAAAHRDVVRDYVRARVIAHRDVLADRRQLPAQASQRLGPSAFWPLVAEAYLDTRAWDPDGGLTRSDIERTLAFFIAHGSLDASLTVDAVADLSYLASVLDELGRYPGVPGQDGR